jgi:MarR family transcriptional regulator, 2-MHQ and catechol-resistance regulon repressor
MHAGITLALRLSAEAQMAARDQALALKLWVVLSRSYNAVSRHSEADITRHGLSTGEFAIMEALYHKGALLLGEIQRKILVTSGGVTYLVDRLEAGGLVQRRDCPEDRRARYAVLTRKGKDLMKRIFPDHAAAMERATAGLSATEKKQAIELLRKLGHAAAAVPTAEKARSGGTDGARERRRSGERR